MAYQTSASKAPISAPAHLWDDLRREARRLESELDMRLAVFAKLCSGSEADFRRKGETGLAAEQMAQSKAEEIEGLLDRLSDVNSSMSSQLTGANDSHAHTVARHRDILAEFSQEARRLTSALGAARDRADLVAGSSESAPLMHSGSNLLLRERGNIQSANNALDAVLGQASAVGANLGEQRHLFENTGSKLMNVTAKFPMVNSIMNSIRRKKSKDTIILSAVVAVCTLFILVYWWNK
ncbi:hypothetical protein WJX73_009120 [Symbiochloris irregularis]|uniref:Golgi SNAP receptor complex member 1 n=2 Tax=Symbiochloris irregularis TaxID=706552 RepID=A0AAW1NPT8_9CHLO